MKREPSSKWNKQVTQALLAALKEKDSYTYGHSLRVAKNSRLLAKAAGLGVSEQETIEYAGLFHDLGKIAIPDSILKKPGSLTESEEKIMRTHPVKSVEVLEPLCHLCFFKRLIPGIRHHHEQYNGAGYPDGIRGEKIPLHARIIAIADTYDAITTTRPYRQGRASEIAYRELKNYSGIQFDPELVEIFLKCHPQWGKSDKRDEELVEKFLKKAA